LGSLNYFVESVAQPFRLWFYSLVINTLITKLQPKILRYTKAYIRTKIG